MHPDYKYFNNKEEYLKTSIKYERNMVDVANMCKSAYVSPTLEQLL